MVSAAETLDFRRSDRDSLERLGRDRIVSEIEVLAARRAWVEANSLHERALSQQADAVNGYAALEERHRKALLDLQAERERHTFEAADAAARILDQESGRTIRLRDVAKKVFLAREKKRLCAARPNCCCAALTWTASRAVRRRHGIAVQPAQAARSGTRPHRLRRRQGTRRNDHPRTDAADRRAGRRTAAGRGQGAQPRGRSNARRPARPSQDRRLPLRRLRHAQRRGTGAGPGGRGDRRRRDVLPALVSLDQPYFRKKDQTFDLKPGMTATAEIVTERKTLLQILLRPIYELEP